MPTLKSVEATIFWETYINTVAADALALYIGRPSATIIIDCLKGRSTSHEERSETVRASQQSVPSQWWEMLENANIFLFAEENSACKQVTPGVISFKPWGPQHAGQSSHTPNMLFKLHSMGLIAYCKTAVTPLLMHCLALSKNPCFRVPDFHWLTSSSVSSPARLFMSTSAFLQTMVAKRRPIPWIEKVVRSVSTILWQIPWLINSILWGPW